MRQRKKGNIHKLQAFDIIHNSAANDVWVLIYVVSWDDLGHNKNSLHHLLHQKPMSKKKKLLLCYSITFTFTLLPLPFSPLFSLIYLFIYCCPSHFLIWFIGNWKEQPLTVVKIAHSCFTHFFWERNVLRKWLLYYGKLYL